MAELQVRVAADVASAITALQKLEKEFDRAKLGAEEIAGQSEKAAGKLRSLPNATNQASAALTNFGRVIQDAPYGIIGIANNIDPLVTSFNQLKSTTGSTKAALGELIAGLAGPAGMAIAISTITSLLVKFGDQLFSSSKKMSDAELNSINYSESVDRISESFKKLRDELDFGNAIAKINNELKGLTGAGLDLANAEVDIASNNKYISDLDNRLSPLKEKFNGLTNEAKKYLTETQKFKDIPAEQFAPGAQQYILNKRSELDAFYSYYLEFGKISDDLVKKLSKSDQQRFANLQKDNNQLFQLQDERAKYVNQNAILEAQILLDKYNKEQEIFDKTIKQAKELSDYFKDRINIQFKISPFEPKEETYINAKDFIFKIQNGLFRVFEEGWNKSIRDIRDAELTPIELKNIRIVLSGGEIPNFRSEVEKSIKRMNQEGIGNREFFQDKNKNIPSGLSTQAAKEYEDYLKAMEDMAKEVENRMQSIRDTLVEMAVSTFVTLGEAIGTALAGGDVAGVFKSFALQIGEGFQSIGKQMIRGSQLMIALRKALDTFNPALALPAGIALVALGAALKASANKGVSARATGGPVSGNNPYLVGERGPELFVPSVSGSIVPNNQVGSFMGGRMMGGGGTGSILRGQDIILAYARTQRSQLRVNG